VTECFRFEHKLPDYYPPINLTGSLKGNKNDQEEIGI
jgi:hypothetical protein